MSAVIVIPTSGEIPLTRDNIPALMIVTQLSRFELESKLNVAYGRNDYVRYTWRGEMRFLPADEIVRP